MYFENIETTEELKNRYRQVAKMLHPDFGGNEEDFKKMVVEYEKATEKLLKGDTTDTLETMEKFRDIIDELLSYNDIIIEVCGNWIWISGNTKPIKEEIKALGCFWARKKKMWYYRPQDYKKLRGKKSTLSMEEIRGKYGSKIFQSKAKSIK